MRDATTFGRFSTPLQSATDFLSNDGSRLTEESLVEADCVGCEVVRSAGAEFTDICDKVVVLCLFDRIKLHVALRLSSQRIPRDIKSR